MSTEAVISQVLQVYAENPVALRPPNETRTQERFEELGKQGDYGDIEGRIRLEVRALVSRFGIR